MLPEEEIVKQMCWVEAHVGVGAVSCRHCGRNEQRGSGRRRGHGEEGGRANHRLRSGFRCYFEVGSHWRILKRGTETGRPARRQQT